MSNCLLPKRAVDGLAAKVIGLAASAYVAIDLGGKALDYARAHQVRFLDRASSAFPSRKAAAPSVTVISSVGDSYVAVTDCPNCHRLSPGLRPSKPPVAGETASAGSSAKRQWGPAAMPAAIIFGRSRPLQTCSRYARYRWKAQNRCANQIAIMYFQARWPSQIPRPHFQMPLLAPSCATGIYCGPSSWRPQQRDSVHACAPASSGWSIAWNAFIFTSRAATRSPIPRAPSTKTSMGRSATRSD
jgi:hypothetical protein